MFTELWGKYCDNNLKNNIQRIIKEQKQTDSTLLSYNLKQKYFSYY